MSTVSFELVELYDASACDLLVSCGPFHLLLRERVEAKTCFGRDQEEIGIAGAFEVECEAEGVILSASVPMSNAFQFWCVVVDCAEL